MSISAFHTTVSCRQRQPITVNGRWFLAEDVVSSDGTREVCVVSRNEDMQFCLKAVFLRQGVRHELLPDVFITFTDLAKKSRIRLLIEAPTGVPIARGYPRELAAA